MLYTRTDAGAHAATHLEHMGFGVVISSKQVAFDSMSVLALLAVTRSANTIEHKSHMTQASHSNILYLKQSWPHTRHRSANRAQRQDCCRDGAGVTARR